MTSEFAVELRDVVKKFVTPEGRDLAAVNHVSMQIRNGEFFSMLGPSGCGKTTSLRLIAGFEWPSEGEVYIDGQAAGSPTAISATGEYGISELCPVPAHDSVRERRLRPRDGRRAEG